MKTTYIDRKFYNKKIQEYQNAFEYIIHYLLKEEAELVITGMPGSGKSTVMSNIANELITKGAGVIYFSNPSEIETQFKKLANDWNIEYDEKCSSKERGELIATFASVLMDRTYIENSEELQEFYIIFDQVENFNDIKDYYFFSGKKIKVIVISQEDDIQKKSHHNLDDAMLLKMPEFFTPSESKEYITKALEAKRSDITEGKTEDGKNQIDKLLWKDYKAEIPENSRFPYSPYILKSVAERLNEKGSKGISIDQYIEELNAGEHDRPYEIILEYLIDESYADIYMKEWTENTLEKFTKTEQQKLRDGIKKIPQLLQYLSYLDNEYISYDLLKSLFNNEYALDLMELRLLSLSLVTKTVNSQGKDGIKIHQLTQKFTKDFINRHNDLSNYFEVDETTTYKKFLIGFYKLMQKVTKYFVTKNNDLSNHFETDESKIFEKLINAFNDLMPDLEKDSDKNIDIFESELPHIKKILKLLEDSEKSNEIKILTPELAKLYHSVGMGYYLKRENKDAFVPYIKAKKIYEELSADLSHANI